MGCCEFRGDRTCPQCRGLGRVKKKPELNELTSLLRPDDVRLQPSKTKLYTAIGIISTLAVILMLAVFFYPRTVNLVLSDVKTLHSQVETYPFNITVMEKVKLENKNYISVSVKQLAFTWSYFGQQTTHKTVDDLSIPARSFIELSVTLDITETLSSRFKDRVMNNCKSDPLEVSQILMKYTVLGEVVYLAQHRQVVVDDVMYVHCGDDEDEFNGAHFSSML